MKSTNSLEPWGLHANTWQFLQDSNGYVRESKKTTRALAKASTHRQFVTARDILARLNGSQGLKPRRGLLLADDVGLGKTTVAALIAWIARASNMSVRILAPNPVVRRQWQKELAFHVPILRKCAARLKANEHHLRIGDVGKLKPGIIQVTTHWHAVQKLPLGCDLLIVDEAHRAKGDQSEFSKSLRQQRNKARRVLILTATPFSIQIEELLRMLTLIGADDARSPVKAFERVLRKLYEGYSEQDVFKSAVQLADRARAAVEALRSVVIRHGVNDLPREAKSFGGWKTVPLDVRPVSDREFEVRLRGDRLLRLVRPHKPDGRIQTNDPRYDVGWRHFDDEIKKVENWSTMAPSDEGPVVKHFIKSLQRLRGRLKAHPKIVAVASYVVEKVRNGDKVVLFCHHHATAGELTGVLWRKLARLPTFQKLPHRMLRGAWTEILNRGIEHHFAVDPEKLQDVQQYVRIFVKWLSSPLIRGQTESWLRSLPTSHRGLVDALTKIRARSARGPQIAQAAITLFLVLTDPQSKSTRGLLREANDNDDVEFIPGGRKEAPRLLTMCPPPQGEKKAFLYHHKQPDTALAIFNSPFGPDVLIATDALSEGIDLHSYCRTVIHYELNPSPIRTIQREGRLRRINSWAAKTQKPVERSYPCFKGTRDERLVKIMKDRLDAFSLLLGGAPEIQLEDDAETRERWRMEVINAVKSKLQKNSAALRAHPPR